MDPKTHFDLGSFEEKWFCDRNCGWPFNIIDSFLELSPPSPPVTLCETLVRNSLLDELHSAKLYG